VDVTECDHSCSYCRVLLRHRTPTNLRSRRRTRSRAWKADQKWTAPLLFSVSKVTLLGKRPVRFLLAAGPMIASPDDGADWRFRLAATFLFRRDAAEACHENDTQTRHRLLRPRLRVRAHNGHGAVRRSAAVVERGQRSNPFWNSPETPSPEFVLPADRIGTFDNDGTLWAEQPLYFHSTRASMKRMPGDGRWWT
jgi:hypothetical protein